MTVIINKKDMVYGVGINDADYVVHKKESIYVNGKRKQVLSWVCPFYRAWCGMLKRCYSDKYQEQQPTYKGCTVSEEWLIFSNFRAWMIKQDCEGMQLDKDILVKGNKVYSKEVCVFVTHQTNIFITDSAKTRGKWMIGVSWNKEKTKFSSKCSNPFTKKLEHLGYFTCEQEAHKAWLKRKLEHAYALAAIQTDQRVADALVKRYLYYEV